METYGCVLLQNNYIFWGGSLSQNPIPDQVSDQAKVQPEKNFIAIFAMESHPNTQEFLTSLGNVSIKDAKPMSTRAQEFENNQFAQSQRLKYTCQSSNICKPQPLTKVLTGFCEKEALRAVNLLSRIQTLARTSGLDVILLANI